MDRLRVFRDEFLESLSLIGNVADKTKKWQELIGLLIIISPTLFGYAAPKLDFLHWIQPWSIWLFFLSALILVWKAGGAWSRSAGPIIRIVEGLEIDPRFPMFCFSVECRGRGEVIAEAFADELRDHLGQIDSTISSEVEISRRGMIPGTVLTLHPGKPGRFGFLQVDITNPASPVLCLCGQAPSGAQQGQYSLVPLLGGPISKQQEKKLNVRIDFRDSQRKHLCSKSKWYSIVPDGTSPNKYQIKG
jgi:hypothetical protein